MPAAILLVVEDNDAARQALTRVLREEGYQVLAAADGREALHHLDACPRPDLILLDMVMPGLDGWSFLERLRRKGPPRIPVIITSGLSLSREWAEARGCQGFVRKPVEVDALLREVSGCLGQNLPVPALNT